MSGYRFKNLAGNQRNVTTAAYGSTQTIIVNDSSVEQLKDIAINYRQM